MTLHDYKIFYKTVRDDSSESQAVTLVKAQTEFNATFDLFSQYKREYPGLTFSEFSGMVVSIFKVEEN